MLKLILIALSIGTIAGCAPGSDSAPSEPKALWSVWMNTSSHAQIDLSAGDFGTPFTTVFNFAFGGVCTCTLSIVGNEDGGNYTLASCSMTTASSPPPDCNALNGTGTYAKSKSSLTICRAGCATYQ